MPKPYLHSLGGDGRKDDIITDLEAALEQFRLIAADVGEAAEETAVQERVT